MIQSLIVVKGGLFIKKISITTFKFFGRHAESIGNTGVVEVAFFQTRHEAASNAIVYGIDIDFADESFSRFRVANIFKTKRHSFIVLNRYQSSAFAAHKELHSLVAEIAGVVNIVSNGRSATQFVADFFIDDRNFNADAFEFSQNFLLEDFAEVKFRVTNMAMFVELNVAERGKIFVSDFLNDAFSDDRDAVIFSNKITFDNRARDNVNNLLQANFFLREFAR